MERSRKKYTRKFKIKVVCFRTGLDISIAQASMDLRINLNLLRDGRKEFQWTASNTQHRSAIKFGDAMNRRSTFVPCPAVIDPEHEYPFESG
jgi:hypothetical protein